MKINLRQMRTNWQENYKPMIKLLMQQENGHYAAWILVFCCIEHAYRANKGISVSDLKVNGQEAIEHVMGIWTTHYNPNEGEIREIQNRNMADYANCLLRSSISNRLTSPCAISSPAAMTMAVAGCANRSG